MCQNMFLQIIKSNGCIDMKKRLIKAVDIDNIHISDEDFKSVAEKYIDECIKNDEAIPEEIYNFKRESTNTFNRVFSRLIEWVTDYTVEEFKKKYNISDDDVCDLVDISTIDDYLYERRDEIKLKILECVKEYMLDD